MSNKHLNSGFNAVRMIQKLFVSVFVICTFIVYAVHERLTNPDGAIAPSAPTENASTSDRFTASIQATPTAPLVAFAVSPTAPTRTGNLNSNSVPTQTPRPTLTAQSSPTANAKSSGAWRDGSYTGSKVNAYWGLVQVKATVQNGRITDVQFLQYPNDRRTSQFINSQAMPYLQTEVIRAQNANVDIISGATLTSQAFIRSLQSALSTAKN